MQLLLGDVHNKLCCCHCTNEYKCNIANYATLNLMIGIAFALIRTLELPIDVFSPLITCIE